MFKPAPALWVDANQEKRLKYLVASGKTPHKIVLRARIILLAGEGVPNHAIAARLGTSRPTVLRWRGRFQQSGVPGLLKDARRPGRTKAVAPELIKRVVEATRQTTPPAATHWSTRTMARAQGLSRMTVQRIWRQHGLQPHRVETFKLSRDPHFVEKLRDVVGLYWDPRTRPWSCQWTRRARSRRWTARPRCCRGVPGSRPVKHRITLAMGRRCCWPR